MTKSVLTMKILKNNNLYYFYMETLTEQEEITVTDENITIEETGINIKNPLDQEWHQFYTLWCTMNAYSTRCLGLNCIQDQAPYASPKHIKVNFKKLY